MNVRVVYASQTGNTKKVAASIASALGIEAESVGEEGSAVEAELPVGLIVKDLRQRNGMTQEELAHRLRTTKSVVLRL